MLEKNGIKIITENIDIAGTGHITNCYVVYDKENNGVIIDPAYDAGRLDKIIKENNITLKAILITHCHADHIAALKEVMEKFSESQVYIHAFDLKGLNDDKINCKEVVKVELAKVNINIIKQVNEGDRINIGETSYEVIHTPGHTKGSIVLYENKSQVLFTGDTIFENTYGRTDLETGSHDDMKESLDKLFNRFGDNLCLPGHGNQFILSNVKRKINLLFAFKG